MLLEVNLNFPSLECAFQHYIPTYGPSLIQGVHCSRFWWSIVSFLLFVFIAVVIYDVDQNADSELCQLLTSSGNLFLKYE